MNRGQVWCLTATNSLDGIDAVFDMLRRAYDIDFAHYKPNTVSRRISRRLTILDLPGLEEYVARLREDKGQRRIRRQYIF